MRNVLKPSFFSIAIKRIKIHFCYSFPCLQRDVPFLRLLGSRRLNSKIFPTFLTSEKQPDMLNLILSVYILTTECRCSQTKLSFLLIYQHFCEMPLLLQNRCSQELQGMSNRIKSTVSFTYIRHDIITVSASTVQYFLMV